MRVVLIESSSHSGTESLFISSIVLKEVLKIYFFRDESRSSIPNSLPETQF